MCVAYLAPPRPLSLNLSLNSRHFPQRALSFTCSAPVIDPESVLPTQTSSSGQGTGFGCVPCFDQYFIAPGPEASAPGRPPTMEAIEDACPHSYSECEADPGVRAVNAMMRTDAALFVPDTSTFILLTSALLRPLPSVPGHNQSGATGRTTFIWYRCSDGNRRVHQGRR